MTADDPNMAGTESRLRDALEAHAQRYHPRAGGLHEIEMKLDAAERRSHRHRVALATASVAAAVAALVGVVLLRGPQDGAGQDAASTPGQREGVYGGYDREPAPPPTRAPEPPEPTTPVASGPVVWPVATMAVSYDDPRAAALRFAAEYLGIPDATVGDIATPVPPGTIVDVFGGDPPVATSVVLVLNGTQGWGVTGATSPELPALSAQMVADGVHVEAVAEPGAAAEISLVPLGQTDPVAAVRVDTDTKGALRADVAAAPGAYTVVASLLDGDGRPRAASVTVVGTATAQAAAITTEGQPVLVGGGVSAEDVAPVVLPTPVDVPGPAVSASLAPGGAGAYVAFESATDSCAREIWLLSGDATAALVAEGSWPAVSADGTQLAYVTGCTGGDAAIEVLDLARGTVQEIAQPPNGPAAIRWLTWSPDGRSLAYELDTGSAVEVAVVGAGATTLADQVTVARSSSDGGAGRPSFRPDGSLLYVVARDPSLASGPATLVAADLQSGATTDVLSVPNGVLSLSVSAQGQVAFVDATGTLWHWEPAPADALPKPFGKGYIAVGW